MKRLPSTIATALAVFVAGILSIPHPTGFAQEQDKVEFEVASLKLAPPESGDFRLFWIAGGRFIATNATLKQLVEFAYDVRGEQISGGPRWLDSDEYNVEAKPGSATPIPEGFAASSTFRTMARSLLEDRFKLNIHRESREGQIYELQVAKSGPKLPAATKTVPSGLFPGRSRVDGKAASMSLLAKYLSGPTGRVVVNKTGLDGSYDFTLTWTAEPRSAPETPAAPDSQPDVNGPSIFTALQEQLGVRLQAAKGPVDLIIIDHAEKPDLN
jgi:uncharacterized protein (TIGR03435 family)